MLQHAVDFIHHHGRHPGTSRPLRQFYASTSIQVFALSIVGVFIPVYLYTLGFSIAEIAIFHLIHYAVRILAAVPVAKLIDIFGIKHVLAASYVLTFFKAVMLITLPEVGFPLWFIATVDGLDHLTYFLPYHAGVSKLKQTKKAGKQLSLIYQWNKLAASLGPVLGGIIAYNFGIVYALIITAVAGVISIIPLTLSPEPIRQRQNTKLAQLPWRKIRADLISQFSLAFNQLSTQALWVLFLGVYIFTQDTYLGLGIISSLGLLLSILVARYFGRVVDRQKGLAMMRYSTPVQALTHLFRVFITAAPIAYVFNLLSQPSALGAGLPYSKGYMARGDELAKCRILYIAVMEIVNYTAKIIGWAVVFVIATAGHAELGIKVVFLISIPMTMLVLLERFSALRPRVVASRS